MCCTSEKPPRAKLQTGGVVWDRKVKASLRDADPRVAILRYAKDAAENPFWVAPAYKRTQPTAVLADKVIDDDEADRVLENEDRQRAVKRRKT